MLAKGFTEEESKNHSIQQRVCRAAEQAPVCEAATTKVQASVCAAAHIVTCSNSKEVSLVSISPIEKKSKIERSTEEINLNKICQTSHQANQERTNQMIKKQHYSCVFMKATVMYAEQKQIHGGRMSSATIAEMFNCEHNVSISPQVM